MGREIMDLPAPAADARIRYGTEPGHFADLRLPAGVGPHPAALAIHGGFWRGARNLEYMGHLCEALRGLGIATWNIEYRRAGEPGGGWPGTCEDAITAARQLIAEAATHGIDPARIVLAGHSAGGHLALWLAGQRLAGVRGVVALAPAADLELAWELDLGDGAAGDFLGGSPAQYPERYSEASPARRLPFGVPIRLVHGDADDIVPIALSRRFADAAVNAGDNCELVTLPGGDHFIPVDPRSSAWPVIRAIIRSVLE